MSDTALRTVGLGKMYTIGGERATYRTLRDTLAQAAKRPLERLRHPGAATHTSEEFWALRDIDLEVKHGEVLGIIGRNGSGKSTLLKVLSRITQPTEGRVEIRGRIASLLEVGTGFHGELTGRENIQLNGAILGMRRKEIRRNFDDIVDFAQVEKFLDTPVKHYSSGMYMRLAFAVAAHMEPEILMIDEVLAVGDLQFQKKCLGKMGQIAGQGRTVLLVSHNMQAVRALCRQAIVLENGELVRAGAVEPCIQAYSGLLSDNRFTADLGVGDERVRKGSGAAKFTSLRMLDALGEESSVFRAGESVSFRLTFDVIRPVDGLDVSIFIRSGKTREFVTTILHRLSNGTVQPRMSWEVTITVDELPLRPGEYPLYFNLTSCRGASYDLVGELTPPLVVTTDSSFDELGYDPAAPVGFFSIRSHLSEVGTGDGGERNGQK